MHRIFLLLLSLATVQASVFVTRTSSNDMHPSVLEIEVQLPDTNKNVRIPLTKTEAFENIPVTQVENGVSMIFSSHQIHHASHAHYRHIESKSVISVRTVNGIRRISGHVMHEGISYFLEPFGETDHSVTKNTLNPEAMTKKIETGVNIESRRKRQTNKQNTKYKVELNLLIDSRVWSIFKKLHGTDTEANTELHFYYTHILNGIDTAYRNIGTPSISVRCIGMTISKSLADDAWMAGGSTDGDIILKNMSKYIVGRSGDHFMAFTRLDFQSKGDFSTCGLAYLGGVCTEHRVSINEDHGMHSWGTAAHELGHNLGALHDGDGNNCRDSSKNIMAPSSAHYSLSDVSNSYRFSSCSVSYISDYLKKLGSSNCLTSDQGRHLTHLASSSRQGARLTLDQVCRLALPDSPGKFFQTDDPASSICAKIYCLSNSGEGTGPSELRAPVGTPCGNKKSCNWDGQCSEDKTAPAADEACFFGNLWKDKTCLPWKTAIEKKHELCTAKIKKGCCKALAKLC